REMSTTARAALLLGVGIAVGCTSSSTGPTGTAGSSASSSTSMVCTPGTQLACTTPGGDPGFKACKSDGSGLEPCVNWTGAASSSSAASSSASSSGNPYQCLGQPDETPCTGGPAGGLCTGGMCVLRTPVRCSFGNMTYAACDGMPHDYTVTF